MTVGKLIEALVGKAGVFEGRQAYASAFGEEFGSADTVQSAELALIRNGFNYTGKDVFYSGVNGAPLDVSPHAFQVIDFSNPLTLSLMSSSAGLHFLGPLLLSKTQAYGARQDARPIQRSASCINSPTNGRPLAGWRTSAW